MLYHWSTARAYLAYKAAKYKAALKRDVFLSLKMHRAEVYRIVSCADLIYTHLKEQLLRSLIFKLKNIADYNTC